MKKVCIVIITIYMLLSFGNVFGESYSNKEMDSQFNSYLDELNSFANDTGIDIKDIASNLKQGKGLSVSNTINLILNIIFKDVKEILIVSSTIIILVIISSILKAMQLENGSSVIKITNILIYTTICTLIIYNLKDVIDIFKSACDNYSNIVQIVSPFLMSMMIVTGGVSSYAIIQPLILFLSSYICFFSTEVLLPILILTACLSVIGNLSEKSGIVKLGKFFRKTCLWSLGIIQTVYLGVLSLNTSIAKDVDSLAVKTTIAATSNLVPVASKFFSDSFEIVVGASKVITKIGGAVGIITTLITAVTPIVKIFSFFIVYVLISNLSEILDSDKKSISIVADFADLFKVMCGIIIINSITFIISNAIILNLISSIVN